LVLGLALILTTVDALSAIKRFVQYVLAIRNGDEQFRLRTLWRNVILGQDDDYPASKFDEEYTGLVAEPEELKLVDEELRAREERARASGDHFEQHPTERWANDVHRHHERGSEWRQSVASDGTLFHSVFNSRRGSTDDSEGTIAERHPTSKASLLRKIGSGVFAVLERLLVILGYLQFLTGVVVYSGTCRDSYVNGCLAHLISASGLPSVLVRF
jgi:hypothetical protein